MFVMFVQTEKQVKLFCVCVIYILVNLCKLKNTTFTFFSLNPPELLAH